MLSCSALGVAFQKVIISLCVGDPVLADFSAKIVIKSSVKQLRFRNLIFNNALLELFVTFPGIRALNRS